MNDSASVSLLNKREFVRQIIAPTGWGKRLGNFIIDYIVSSLLVGGLVLVVAVVWGIFVSETLFAGLDGMNPWIDRIVTFALRVGLYYIPLEYFTGKTIGKMITRTKVVTQDGEKPELGEIITRNLTRIFAIEIFSFLSENPIGWHDKAGNTMVVDDIPLYNLEEENTTHFYGEDEKF